MRERVVYHVDMNNCYASIECLHHPKLRGHPVAVGGDMESRHGIILAKNYEAKKYGIRTGETLIEARQKCADLIIVPPSYKLYQRVSRDFKAILHEYTDTFESFGLDEEWLDLTHTLHLCDKSAVSLADEIRERVYREIGVTVSIGISFNKIFAKLGSDMKKPDACTAVTKENYKQTAWALPAEDLLGVGSATKKKLFNMGIKTIGDLANFDVRLLQSRLGKWGIYLHAFANGQDDSPVSSSHAYKNVSVGNSTTTRRDLIDEADCHFIFLNLAESVAERVRDLGYKARTIEISLRDKELHSMTRQMTIEAPTNLAYEMADTAMILLKKHCKWEKPLRSIGIRASNFVEENDTTQISLFRDENFRDRLELAERTMDYIRHRYGHFSIGRASLLEDRGLGWINPKADHTIHPIGYF